MDANGLRELYDHHASALDRVLAYALEVSPEQAVAKPWQGVPSLRDVLAHIVTAERASIPTLRAERTMLPGRAMPK